MEFHNLSVEVKDHIGYLTLTKSEQNSFDAKFLAEIVAAHDALESDEEVWGVIWASASDTFFSSGLDANYMLSLDRSEKLDMFRQLFETTRRVFAFSKPELALLPGHAFAAGSVLAMAADWRFMAEGKARVSFPEVMLGLHPGLGGTVRFTRLVSPMQAMPMMLTGKTIDARRAKSLGLVDAVTQERHVRNAVKDAVFGRLKRARPGRLNKLLNFGPVRGVLASRMRSEAEKAAPREHYPAPYALIDLWEKHGSDKSAMLNAEKRSFAGLMVTSTAQNLIRVFFLREQMKKLAGTGNKVSHVHVIGAGAMGGDIAAWCALRGMTVTLQDQTLERMSPALKRAHALFTKKLRDPLKARAAFDRLIPDPQGDGVPHADVIIEAIFEDMAIKKEIFADLDKICKPGAILASNTSYLDINEIASVTKRPQDVIGLHFFSPANVMKLLEIVRAKHTSDTVVATSMDLAKKINKVAALAGVCPGFIGNRMLSKRGIPAGALLKAGAMPWDIDAAFNAFGFKMGPYQMSDLAGLDIGWKPGAATAKR